jgi:hypothetical protein
MRRLGSILTCCALTLATGEAAAQRYLWGGSAEVVSGAEGGGGYGAPLRRTRTTLRLGGDVRIDETPENVISAAGLVEIEPRTAFGVDARYVRIMKRFALGAGGIGFLAPSTLFGATADVIYRHPLSASTAFTVGPSVNVFFLGGDLPEEAVFWQVVLRAGFRADL